MMSRMLRTVWAAIVAVAITIPVSLAVIAVSLVSSSAPLIDSMIRWWARRLVGGAGIDLRLEGGETIDWSQRYVLVPNHYSYFDIPCILGAIEHPIRFMAKQSLFSVPIFGWAIGRAGFIPVDRKDRSKAAKSFGMAAERIRKQNSIVIFPEGGRTPTRELREFQRGAFLLAKKSALPLLPIAIDGTFDVFRVGASRVTPGRVTVKIGTPIDPSAFSVRDKDALSSAARTQIEGMLFGSAGIT
jgi:1-acyl-sn-glycerol-3-phosphate acyltransferase